MFPLAEEAFQSPSCGEAFLTAPYFSPVFSDISRAFLADRANEASQSIKDGAEDDLTGSTKLFVFIFLPISSRPHVLSS
jgi:hypothetical protein